GTGDLASTQAFLRHAYDRQGRRHQARAAAARPSITGHNDEIHLRDLDACGAGLSEVTSKGLEMPRATLSVKVGSAEDELFLQPWFLSKPAYRELRRLLPPSQMLKMRYYFEDYGCLRCGSLKAIYCSNGLCRKCSVVVRARVVLALRRRFRKLGVRVAKQPLEMYLAAIFERNRGARPNSVLCPRDAR